MNDPITDALQTKCSACGGFMEYSPAAENLKCKYCGAITELDKTAAKIVENDFLYWKDRSDESGGDDIVEATEIRCRQCGAITSLSPNVSGGKCAFCGTPLIMNEATVKRFWQPNYLLPFKVTDRQSGKNFASWLSNKWLAPSKLKKSAVSFDAFKGVYLPFWTYDANTYTDYKGERGVNRTVSFTNSKGQTSHRTVTDWYPKNGNVHVVFDDVLVPASPTLPPFITTKLTNWDLMNCVAYRKEFLAGFITEIYQRDFRVAIDDAKKKMNVIIDSNIRRDIGGDQQNIRSKNTQYQDLKFKHLLLPVWISAFRFNDKLYQFVVNGRTGEVIGDYPKSTAKIIMIVLAVIALIAGFYYFTQ
jgi:LSD1 subclass zinc finger protein